MVTQAGGRRGSARNMCFMQALCRATPPTPSSPPALRRWTNLAVAPPPTRVCHCHQTCLPPHNLSPLHTHTHTHTATHTLSYA